MKEKEYLTGGYKQYDGMFSTPCQKEPEISCIGGSAIVNERKLLNTCKDLLNNKYFIGEFDKNGNHNRFTINKD
jgi:hypothetical protein